VTPVLAALLLTGLFLLAWHLGRVLEWFIGSRYCWPFVRRLFFTVLSFTMVWLVTLRILRALL
jgi:hypothetical protein